MISLVRIDDRLIHGQVAVVWTKHLGVNRILVANDQIVNNEVQKMSLRMAALIPPSAPLWRSKTQAISSMTRAPRP